MAPIEEIALALAILAFIVSLCTFVIAIWR